MSLDVYLTRPGEDRKVEGGRIFVREAGGNRELTRAEWDERFPGVEPVVMGEAQTDEVYSANITHNLGGMAAAADIYEPLWRPEEIGIAKAAQLIEPLTEGLAKLKADPAKFEAHNAPNGWGLYEHFVPFVEQYLAACREYPDADVYASR